MFATPNMEIGHLSKRWWGCAVLVPPPLPRAACCRQPTSLLAHSYRRAERNLWMSGFAFAAWL